MSTNISLHNAISSHNVHTLRSLLEDQDRQLLSQIAQYGTPETAAYILSRYPITEDYSQESPSSNPSLYPTQYLAQDSARYGNTGLFSYLINQYPSLLSTNNQAVENILVNAMDGGVDIWQTILHHDPHWKDHEFDGHKGCVLEVAIWLGKEDVLEFLLSEGADMGGSDELLVLAGTLGVGDEIVELIKKYSV
jgi:hypothetical protein